MSFARLDRELDAWSAASRRATLWWRDDDADRDSPALRRMFAIVRSNGVPVAIAAIPATLEASLTVAVNDCDAITVVQHGYAHRNHAGPGERSAEFGDRRPIAARQDELARGRERLVAAFGARFLPVLVPPWNRIAADIIPYLASAGFCGLSCFGPRAFATQAAAVCQSNTHVDLIAWRRDRAFIGTDAALERLVEHLAARRSGRVPDEPSGLLTHHLAFSDEAWAFVAALTAHRHPAIAWLAAPQVFAGGGIAAATAAPISGRSA